MPAVPLSQPHDESKTQRPLLCDDLLQRGHVQRRASVCGNVTSCVMKVFKKDRHSGPLWNGRPARTQATRDISHTGADAQTSAQDKRTSGLQYVHVCVCVARGGREERGREERGAACSCSQLLWSRLGDDSFLRAMRVSTAMAGVAALQAASCAAFAPVGAPAAAAVTTIGQQRRCRCRLSVAGTEAATAVETKDLALLFGRLAEKVLFMEASSGAGACCHSGCDNCPFR
jgi:hypothetical protein